MTPTLTTTMAICTTCLPCTHHHTHHTTLWSIDQSHPALVTDDRTSVGRIIVATIIIYVTWITMQVIQRTLEKYLA